MGLSPASSDTLARICSSVDEKVCTCANDEPATASDRAALFNLPCAYTMLDSPTARSSDFRFSLPWHSAMMAVSMYRGQAFSSTAAGPHTGWHLYRRS